MLPSSVLFLVASYLVSLVAGFDALSKSNVAVYWGQNSYGGQQRLSTYCESDAVDIVLLSFLYSFPSNLQVDFSNACSDSYPDGLKHCSTIAQDIKTCQSLGKKVLLSLGGALGAYGFTSDSQATTFATTLWNKFGGGSDDERPFDDAVVDGFDLDLENNSQTGTVALGKALRTKFAKDTSKTYYLSAAPQCPYPDASVGNFLSGVDVDFAFIQFYNNYCALGSNFNWDTWQTFASGTSPNKNIKLFLGLPGAQSSAGSGYVTPDTVKQYVDQIKSTENFGGIMLWDASSGFGNVVDGTPFVKQMKRIVSGSSSDSGKAVTTSVAPTTLALAPTTPLTTVKDTTTLSSTSVPNVLTKVITPTAFETYTRIATTFIVSTVKGPQTATYDNGQYRADYY